MTFAVDWALNNNYLSICLLFLLLLLRLLLLNYYYYYYHGQTQHAALPIKTMSHHSFLNVLPYSASIAILVTTTISTGHQYQEILKQSLAYRPQNSKQKLELFLFLLVSRKIPSFYPISFDIIIIMEVSRID